MPIGWAAGRRAEMRREEEDEEGESEEEEGWEGVEVDVVGEGNSEPS